MCRKHFLVWAFMLPTGALGRCRPAEAALREPPMPLPPGNLQPVCKRYLTAFRCLLKHLKGAPLWHRRDELRQALLRWRAMPHLLPRLCVLSSVRLKMQLASAKLTTVCPTP